MDLTEALLALRETGASLSSNGLGGLQLHVPPGAGVSRSVVAVLAPRQADIAVWLQFKAWAGEYLGDLLAIDTETSVREEPEIPGLAVAAVWNGSRGVFLERGQLHDFFQAHREKTRWVMHSASFDVPVLAQASGFDVESFVHQDRVHDTLLMEQLVELATTGRAARGDNQGQTLPQGYLRLEQCAKRYFDRVLVKDDTRTSFEPYVGASLGEIPLGHQVYAAADVEVTYRLWLAQLERLPAIKNEARLAYGYYSPDELTAMWDRFGPLSLNVQVKASVVFKAMTRLGLRPDVDRARVAMDDCDRVMEETTPIFTAVGIPAKQAAKKTKKGELGKVAALQALLTRIEKEATTSGKLSEPFPRTSTGLIQFSKETQPLIQSVTDDPALVAYVKYLAVDKLKNTYLSKLVAKKTLHPKWHILTRSGRSSCSGDLAAQTLPRDSSSVQGEVSVRQCVRPRNNRVFVGADLKTIEVASLAAFFESQVRYGSELADVIREGRDVHSEVALVMAQALDPTRTSVTPDERKLAKGVVFGLPGGLADDTLLAYIQTTYFPGATLEDAVRGREAYTKICPQLNRHRKRENKLGSRIAEIFKLDSKNEGWQIYHLAKGKKTLKNESDVEEVWAMFAQLPDMLGMTARKRKSFEETLATRKGHPDIAKALYTLVDKSSYLACTGRLRAEAKGTACMNGVFQSPVADGAFLSLWELYYVHKLNPVAMIHDELLFEVEETTNYRPIVDLISSVMREKVSEVLYGLRVEVDPFVRTSLSSKDDVDWKTVEPEPQVEEEPLPPPGFFCSTPPSEHREEPQEEPDLIVADEEGCVLELTTPEPKARKPRNKTRRMSRKVQESELSRLSDEDLPF